MRSLALGVVGGAGRPGPGRVVARSPEGVVDIGSLADVEGGPHADLLAAPTLDALLAAGRPAWREVHGWLAPRLRTDHAPYVLPPAGLELRLPFTVADYVDFFACEQHAVNASEIFRPGAPPLAPNWKHLPVGYHGRAGTVRVSGTPVVRPWGQVAAGELAPTRRLDLEVELGFVLGPSDGPVTIDDALDHVFGVVLLNDWSARDVQAFESRPLGPLLGKSFATSISGWVTPLDELAAAWTDPPPRDPVPLPHLLGPGDRGLDIALELTINGETVSRPPAVDLYWTVAQLVTHLTTNGAPLRAGDLLGSGTVSGARRDQRGCLLELGWGGTEPVALGGGATRTWLEDGDEVVINATAPAVGGGRLELGEVRGRVLPARDA
ncbi:fumarylacetoacetate hydrolase family protein [Pseudonocardia hydrocarbonoxydans]|uniref:Fumarylacetoacetase n=1 Tax=Pseudonocardia hydrocarbonoxydans TaxID=76726 RepID=A0A4Y3WSJ3_9PSEU|nr:fumarylacetoacetate hydrolase family protein [Pseudonocardia hydrocarbonoxydans]GEC21271.1 fumarylacetoacetase [Pseudonocardia hydrocarbonoxydans]